MAQTTGGAAGSGPASLEWLHPWPWMTAAERRTAERSSSLWVGYPPPRNGRGPYSRTARNSACRFVETSQIVTWARPAGEMHERTRCEAKASLSAGQRTQFDGPGLRSELSHRSWDRVHWPDEEPFGFPPALHPQCWAGGNPERTRGLLYSRRGPPAASDPAPRTRRPSTGLWVDCGVCS